MKQVVPSAGLQQYEFVIQLPPHYRAREVLLFHGRDPEGIAEQVGPDRIRKGLLLNGETLELDIVLHDSHACCCAKVEGVLSAEALSRMNGVALNMLGLRIDPSPFEEFVQRDGLLGPLVSKQPGLRIAQTATAFEALTWAIIGQQINLAFAISLRRSFILLAAKRNSEGGLWCYPDADTVARLDADQLAPLKFSRAKAETLIRVARLVSSGELPLAQMADLPIEEIVPALLAIKGVGPWTVNYTLLRGFGSADCSLHGDAAIKAALHRLTKDAARPDTSQAELLLERYKPYRSMAAAHLWASLHIAA